MRLGDVGEQLIWVQKRTIARIQAAMQEALSRDCVSLIEMVVEHRRIVISLRRRASWSRAAEALVHIKSMLSLKMVQCICPESCRAII